MTGNRANCCGYGRVIFFGKNIYVKNTSDVLSLSTQVAFLPLVCAEVGFVFVCYLLDISTLFSKSSEVGPQYKEKLISIWCQCRYNILAWELFL